MCRQEVETTALAKRTPFDEIEGLRLAAPEWFRKHREFLGLSSDDQRMDYWIFELFTYTEDGSLIRRIRGGPENAMRRTGRSMPFAVASA